MAVVHFSPLQQQIHAGGQHMQAINLINRDFDIQAIGVLQIALDNDALGVGLHLFQYFQIIQPTQYVQHFGAHFGRGAGGELFPGVTEVNALFDRLAVVI